MTSRADFTDEEWARLGRAPLIAALAVSLSDPGGPIETAKELSAGLRTVVEASREGTFGGFVRSVADDVAARAQRRENPLAGFAPDRRHARDEILDELRSVHALLVDKAAPEDLDDFREWMRITSQRAALAAKEGGFLGIGGTQVSE